MFKTNEATMRIAKDDRKVVSTKPSVPKNKATISSPAFSKMNDIIPESVSPKRYTKTTNYRREV